MATAEEVGNGLEFLSDLVDRFPLLDLASTDFNSAGEPDTCFTQSAVESSMGDIGDAPLTIQVAENNGCEELSLSAADSQQSTGKDDRQAPGWTKRGSYWASPSGRVCALEKTLRGYAEKRTDTVLVPAVGYNFGSLGEAYDSYNLYSWEIGLGIRYGKSRLNVERTKCMQEIVCGCSVSSK
ncbi:unnamed protein product [Triticum turgidum subsp. durum]|uniref:Uncharacterized protein n=1 Tax=Triticum turgidum subsp. durum TaxID=4567 RepID=A0A9R0TNG4_TRITD|nr:unnamed protein product [Triticum turgidum subsp. durum]